MSSHEEHKETQRKVPSLLFKDEVNKIVGAAIEVHKELGNGFLESVYEEAMKIVSTERNIPFETQVRIPVYFKGKLEWKRYIRT
ncbi:MAG: GxxExxY protein [Candidatus Cloacimonetes bacterium]|nr:GxxExxY protein [Candidatus Cloacimonadota bacterium]